MTSILAQSLALLFLGTAAAAAQSAPPAAPEGTRFEATLDAQAVLPADTAIPAPADAPESLRHAGKFTTADRKRTEALGTVAGKDGARPTGFGLPLDGQPVQGFSGIRRMPDGTFWSLSDNGFGSKVNSSDAMLMLHHLAIDWPKGEVKRLETVFLSDPNKLAPFPIVAEASETRYLTGADFDVESIQPTADGFFVGDEFGPYLLRFDRQGRLQAAIDTTVGGVAVRSPDNPTLQLPADPTKPLPPEVNIKRSGGFEGLAMAPDGAKLYGLLEGPLFKDGAAEKTADGRTGLRIVEFDVAKGAWTGRSWLYPLSAEGGIAIGDFNMLDAATALVIERDNGAGRVAGACAGEAKPDCFATPAKLKRVYKIRFDDSSVGGSAQKLGFVDLLAIRDPKGVAKQGTTDGVYDMPFVTIENVDRVDATHIVVANDNNFPYSAGRQVNRADDDEFVLLRVPELLDAQ